MPELRDLTDSQYTNIKSLDAARWVGCLAFARLKHGQVSPLEVFRTKWPKSPHLSLLEQTMDRITRPKAAVGAIHGGASSLMPAEFMAALVTLARPLSVVEQVQRFTTRAPFNTRIIAESVVPTVAAWTGAGFPKIVIKGTLDSTSLPPRKIAAISISTEELLTFGALGSAEMMRSILVGSVAEKTDDSFTNPAVAAVADVSPASITHGITPVAFTGAPDVDFDNLDSAFVAGGGRMGRAVYLLSTANAQALSRSGGDGFQNVESGKIGVVPALMSDGVGDRVILIDAPRVLIADDGAGAVDSTNAAAVEMSDAPTQNDIAGTGAALVSLWQNNLVGLLLERFINWEALPGAVAYLEGSFATGAGRRA